MATLIDYFIDAATIEELIRDHVKDSNNLDFEEKNLSVDLRIDTEGKVFAKAKLVI